MQIYVDILIQTVVPIIIAFIASSGFWVFLDKRRSDKTRSPKSAETELLIGLAHDRIIYLGAKYIARGWITHDEFENLEKYLFTPYLRLGGNGTAQRIMDEVKKLPFDKTEITNAHAQGDD